jgi:hypothetical protein
MSVTIEPSDWRRVRATVRQAIVPGTNARTRPKRTGNMRFMGMSATPASSEANSEWKAASSAVMSIVCPAMAMPAFWSRAATARLASGNET